MKFSIVQKSRVKYIIQQNFYYKYYGIYYGIVSKLFRTFKQSERSVTSLTYSVCAAHESAKYTSWIEEDGRVAGTRGLLSSNCSRGRDLYWIVRKFGAI